MATKPPYTRAAQQLEDAIIEGDTFTVGKFLPQLTGHELDQNGFPLLYLAAREDQLEIFGMLLRSGRFSPHDQGLCAATDEEALKAIGCTPDPELELQWGRVDKQHRQSLYMYLLGGAGDDLEHHHDMARTLMQHADISEDIRADKSLEFAGLGFPIDTTFSPNNRIAYIEAVIRDIAKSGGVAQDVEPCRELWTNFDYRTLPPETRVAIVEQVIDALDRHYNPDQVESKELLQILDRCWPHTDINKVRGGELLADALCWFGYDPKALSYVHPDRSDDSLDRPPAVSLSEYVCKKLVQDPRLDLPAETLARAYVRMLNSWSAEADKDTYLEGDPEVASNFLEFNAIPSLKNFDPNFKTDGIPPVARIVQMACEDAMLPDDKRVHFDLQSNGNHAIHLIDELIYRPEFDPYDTCENGMSLLEFVRSFKHRDSDINFFIAEIEHLIETSMTEQRAPILRRLEKLFEHKIPPGGLLDEHGGPIQGIEIAARIRCLPDFLTAGRWSGTLEEAEAYRQAIEHLPADFREQYRPQIDECLDQIAERRVILNRDAPQGDAAAHLRRYLSGRGSGGPAGPGGAVS